MTDIPKGVFILAVAGAIGYQGFKALDIDYLAQSPSAPTKHSKAIEKSEDAKLEAIMAGADPTDVLAPTAAGKKLKYVCDSGYIAGDPDGNRFSKINYASIKKGGVTYIQVSRYSPSYLVQEHYQTVSATEVDNLPDSIKTALQVKINNPANCENQDLYLSSIKYLK